MRKPRPPRPVELHDQSIIAAAVSFAAFQFRGRFNRRTEKDLPTLDAARAKAAEFLAENQFRPVLIYAIDAKGRQAHVENVTT